MQGPQPDAVAETDGARLRTTDCAVIEQAGKRVDDATAIPPRTAKETNGAAGNGEAPADPAKSADVVDE